MPGSCELCGMHEATDRCCSSGICRDCRDAGGLDAIRARGCLASASMEHIAATRHSPERFRWEVVVRMPHDTGLQARFFRESALTRASRWLPWSD